MCVICNKFRPPLSVDNAHYTDDLQLAAQTISMIFTQNQLRERGGGRIGLKKCIVKWVKIDVADESFLILEEQSLGDITIGVYQSKLAKSYTQAHLDEDGINENMIYNDADGMLHARLQSRHTISL